jgi:uncharacterized protein YqeY
MDLLTKLQDDMKTAMKTGQKDRLQVIRMLISDVKIIDMAPKPTTAQQAVEAYAKRLRKALEEYEKIGQADEVAKLKFEIGVTEEYLPKKASTEQTAQLVEGFLAKNTFTEKQVGQAMGAFIKAHGALVDPALANTLIRQKLAGK